MSRNLNASETDTGLMSERARASGQCSRMTIQCGVRGCFERGGLDVGGSYCCGSITVERRHDYRLWLEDGGHSSVTTDESPFLRE